MQRSSPWMIALFATTLWCVGSTSLMAQSTTGGSYGLKKPSPWKRFTTGVSSTFKRGVDATTGLFTRDANPEGDDPTSLSNPREEASHDLHVATARLKATNGRTQEAEAMYRQVLEEDPQHLGALLGLARLLDHFGKTDEAVALYRQAVAMHPDEASAHNDFGLCLGRHRRFDEAAAELELAVERQPDKELYRNNLAAVLVAQGRKEEALKHMLEVHPPAVAHYNVGFLLGQSGDVRGGIEQIDLALQSDPQMKEARQQRGLLLAKLPGPVGQHYLAQQQQFGTQSPPAAPQHQVATRPNPFASGAVAGQPVATNPAQNGPAAVPNAAPGPAGGQQVPPGANFPPSRY